MAIQSLTHFWKGPQTRLAFTAGRVGRSRENDWLGFCIRHAQRSGLHGLRLSQRALLRMRLFTGWHRRFQGPECWVHLVVCDGSSPSCRPRAPQSWYYPPGCRTLNEKKVLTFGYCTCTFPDPCFPGDTTEGRSAKRPSPTVVTLLWPSGFATCPTEQRRSDNLHRMVYYVIALYSKPYHFL